MCWAQDSLPPQWAAQLDERAPQQWTTPPEELQQPWPAPTPGAAVAWPPAPGIWLQQEPYTPPRELYRPMSAYHQSSGGGDACLGVAPLGDATRGPEVLARAPNPGQSGLHPSEPAEPSPITSPSPSLLSVPPPMRFAGRRELPGPEAGEVDSQELSGAGYNYVAPSVADRWSSGSTTASDSPEATPPPAGCCGAVGGGERAAAGASDDDASRRANLEGHRHGKAILAMIGGSTPKENKLEPPKQRCSPPREPRDAATGGSRDYSQQGDWDVEWEALPKQASRWGGPRPAAPPPAPAGRGEPRGPPPRPGASLRTATEKAWAVSVKFSDRESFKIGMVGRSLEDEEMGMWCSWFQGYMQPGPGWNESLVAQEVDFSRNRLSSLGVRRLLGALWHAGVTVWVLKLHHNHLESSRDIAELLAEGSLREAHLSHNWLDAAGGAELVLAAASAWTKASYPGYLYPRDTGGGCFAPLWLRLEQNQIDHKAFEARVLAGVRHLRRRCQILCHVDGTKGCTPHVCFACSEPPVVHVPYLMSQQVAYDAGEEW